tara:strand:+ start:1837 stop:2589 length:753 start_codon:yes stop_codon:yes gene_type:complete
MARVKKISSINEAGVVTFTDGRTTSAGTKVDCDYYGGTYSGSVCYIRKEKVNTNFQNKNRVSGANNTIHSSLNINATGNEHTIKNCDSTTVAGKYADTKLDNAFVIGGGSTSGRNQVSTLFFEGRTVETTAATELFIGGVSGQRLTIDESYNRLVLGLDVHATMKAIHSTDTTSGYMHSNACFQSTAGVLAINGSHTASFATSGMSTSSVVVTATAGTPDYIKVHVVGDARMTMDWSVVINVYEIKTNAV